MVKKPYGDGVRLGQSGSGESEGGGDERQLHGLNCSKCELRAAVNAALLGVFGLLLYHFAWVRDLECGSGLCQLHLCSFRHSFRLLES